MARNGPPQNPGTKAGSLAPKELKGKTAAPAEARAIVLRTDPKHTPTTKRFRPDWHVEAPKKLRRPLKLSATAEAGEQVRPWRGDQSCPNCHAALPVVLATKPPRCPRCRARILAPEPPAPPEAPAVDPQAIVPPAMTVRGSTEGNALLEKAFDIADRWDDEHAVLMRPGPPEPPQPPLPQSSLSVADAVASIQAAGGAPKDDDEHTEVTAAREDLDTDDDDDDDEPTKT